MIHKNDVLIIFLSAQSVECILLLLKRKANINILIEKRSALHFAIDRNAVSCVETLLKYGAGQ